MSFPASDLTPQQVDECLRALRLSEAVVRCGDRAMKIRDVAARGLAANSQLPRLCQSVAMWSQRAAVLSQLAADGLETGRSIAEQLDELEVVVARMCAAVERLEALALAFSIPASGVYQ
jgi:hypothetical protein